MDYIRARQPILFRTWIHFRVSLRFLIWFSVVTGLALPFVLPFPANYEEFGQFTLLHGVFLAPLVSAWITARLIYKDHSLDLWTTTGFPLWRVILEKNLLYWTVYILLWTIFLGISWIVFSLRIADSQLSEIPTNLGWRIWFSGVVCLVFFSTLGFALGSSGNADMGGILATVIWVGSLVLAQSGMASSFTPFYAFFDLLSPQLFQNQVILLWLCILLYGVGSWRLRQHKTRFHSIFHSRDKGQNASLSGSTLGDFILAHSSCTLRLLWTELLVVMRRKTLVVYATVPTGLLFLILFTGNEPVTEFAPLALSNFLLVLMPLQAILVAPTFTRNTTTAHDWYWSTPIPWPKSLTAKVLAYGTISLGLSLVIILIPMIGGIFLHRWTLVQILDIFWPLWSLAAIALLAQLLFFCALSILIRHSLTVMVLAFTLAIAVYLKIVAPFLTLLEVRDFTLASLTLNPITGFASEYRIAIWLLFFYLALGILCWQTGLVAYPRLESRVSYSRQAQWRAGTGWLVGLGLVLVSWTGYHQQVQSRIVPASALTQSNIWLVQEASHSAVLSRSELQITSRLSLLPKPEETPNVIEFFLNPGLAILEVSLDNQTVTWSRSGEIVRIDLPSQVIASNPTEPLKIFLDYAGWPTLPREDYERTNDRAIVGDTSVNGYTRETVSFINQEFLQWFRDSDWLIWPVSSQAHVATNSNHLEIVVSEDMYDLVIFPDVPSHIDGHLAHYYWKSSPPSILLIAGAYRQHAVGENLQVYLGPYQTNEDLERASLVADIYRRLIGWQKMTSPTSKVIYFPYGQRTHPVMPWVMVPAKPAQYLPTSDFERLSFALVITEDWLRENIQWAPPIISGQGLLLGASLACDISLPNELQVCRILWDEYGRNPQAPEGREGYNEYCIYPTVWMCGSVSPIRRALAIVLTHYIAAEPSWVHDDEWDHWRRVADSPGWPEYSSALVGFSSNPFHDSCTIARNVTTINQLVEQYGQQFLRDWISLMAEHYPLGSTRPVDDAIWSLAAELIGEQPVLYEAVCSTIMLRE